MIHIGIVHAHLRTHFGELAEDQLAAAVASVAHILAITCAADEHIGTGYIAAHIAQRISG